MAEEKADDQAIFEAARRIESHEARATYLQQACGEDLAQAERIGALLRAFEENASFLESPAVDFGLAPTFTPSVGEKPGTQIGPYKLLQVIGEGGMGVVYMAEQSEPVKRKVALKLIKPGMDSRQVIARFEAERQALSMMDHVNIARVLDAGTTSGEPGGVGSGIPYFVMELIHGIPITKYCDDNHLTPRQRLELFVPVCQAIQHAHQKGIIHRDIKPSNVMVTLYNGKPVPKVIDFGVAKATEQKLTERTLFTQYGTMVGTLEYMSPEQAEMSALGVDTRSDIYSLGVLLYELLTGSTPLSQKRMKEVAFVEILRLIKEEEPPRPSTRLSDSGEALASISALRQTEPARLTQLMRGELDWIVMKTLEKDRNRRYETANGFAADVQRYLADEPVQACPPSTWYRLCKFYRRNKVPLAISGLVLVILVSAGGGVGWILNDRSMRRAATEERIEQALAKSESHFRADNLPEAILSAQSAEALLQFAGGSESLRRRVGDRLSDLSMVEKLEESRLLGAGINNESRFDFESTMRAYSRAFREYGIDVEALDPHAAAEHIRRTNIREEATAALEHWASLPTEKALTKERLNAIVAASDDDPWRNQVRVAARKDVQALKKLAVSWDVENQPPSTLCLFSTSLHGLGETDAAVSLLQKAQRRYPGDFWINQELSYHILRATVPQVDQSIRFQTAAVAVRPRSPGARLRLASLLSRHGSKEEAFAAFQEAIRLKPDFSHAHIGLGQFLLFPCADYQGAVAALSRGLELDPDSATALIFRGGAYQKLGERDNFLMDSLKATSLEPNRPNTWLMLAEAHRGLGNLEEAIVACSRAIELKPDYVAAFRSRGEMYAELDQHELAASDVAKTIELHPQEGSDGSSAGHTTRELNPSDRIIAESSKLLDEDPDSPMHWYGRGAAYQQMGQWEKAAFDYTKAIELNVPGSGVWAARGNVYMKLQQWDKAIADFSKVIELRGGSSLAWYQRGVAFIRLDQTENALLDFLQAAELDPDNLSIRFDLGHAYRGLKQWDKAIAEFSRLVELQPNVEEFVLARGQTYHQMEQWEKAIADFSHAIDLKPAFASGWAERGQCYAELGQWKEAAFDFEKLVGLEPEMPSYWDNRAIAHLGANDRKAYQATCSEMLDRFRNTADPDVAARVASACVAAPNAVADPKQLVALAEVSTSGNNNGNARFVGAALYRSDQPGPALESLRTTARQIPSDPFVLLFLAMAHHRLDQANEARACLGEAESWITAAGRYNRFETSQAETAWESWVQEIGVRALKREARALMQLEEASE